MGIFKKKAKKTVKKVEKPLTPEQKPGFDPDMPLNKQRHLR